MMPNKPGTLVAQVVAPSTSNANVMVTCSSIRSAIMLCTALQPCLSRSFLQQLLHSAFSA
jgi:hypothetical protein